MAATIQPQALPYSVGKITRGWMIAVVAFLALLALGLYAYSLQFAQGESVTNLYDTGTRGGTPWGLYVVFVVYFVGVSFSGIAVAAVVRIINVPHLRPITRMAELLTIVALILGAFSVLVDLGQPARGIVNFFRYARPMSPFFGTFSLVISGYLFASLVYLYLASRPDAAYMASQRTRMAWLYRLWAAGYKDTPEERKRRSRMSLWLAVALLPMLVMAHSTLGFIFGIQVGRPGWYSALQAPEFVVLAGISGIGLLMIVAAVLRLVLREAKRLDVRVFSWLGNFMTVLIVVYIYFLLAELLTAIYQGQRHELEISNALLKGRYAVLFWLSGGLLVLAGLTGGVQMITRRYSIPLLVAAGVLVTAAAILKRFLLVVPSLTMGQRLPYADGGYSPNWVEYSVILGLFALGALMYIAFLKVFPIINVTETE
jgi:molybdopterin-containing oxidoreductase family membrane subunit